MVVSVLVLDDDPHLRRLVSLLLRSNGYEVIEGSNGYDGMDALPAHPALAVVDLRMPGMDGETFCGRAREAGFSGPMLLLSADEEAHYAAGRCGIPHLSKPFEPDILLDAVDDMVHGRRVRV